jgi:hypothetical protein
MHGHHEGTDIVIVDNPEQAREEGFDYFTKLYSIAREYQIEVDALSVKRTQEAVLNGPMQTDFPIRTRTFGWTWTDVSELNDEWLQLAIRSVYVLGLSNGIVKLGILEDGSPIIIGVTSSVQPISNPSTPPDASFSIGADVEFMLDYQGDLVSASRFFPLNGSIGCDERQIEHDSGRFALAELRPQAAECPRELFQNIRDLLVKASERVPYQDVEFRAGSMPFSGYQCGGHIHFGTPVSFSLLRALDHYLAVPMAMIEDSRTAKRRRRTKHGGLGRYRVKPHGFEYLSLSSWMIRPDIALAVLCLAKLVALHHHELPQDFVFDPLVQRAYYGGNRLFLKQKLWSVIKNRIMNVSSYPQYQDELSALFTCIEEEQMLIDSSDIRRNWGIAIGDKQYHPGLTIQVSKKIRNKFDLKIDEPTYVRTKKSITMARVDAHPFAFRNSNAVQLSGPLREALSLPKSWYPQVFQRDGILTLGPIMGILANRPFFGQSTYFRNLCRLGQQKQVLVYVFEPQDIHWDDLVIKGESEHGSGMFPFPDVIYDRYFVGGNHQGLDINEIRLKFQSTHDIPFVNPPSLFQLTADKWKCHEVLSKSMQRNLPATRFLKDASDVHEMLEQFREVYIKPIYGALGQGVLRIFREAPGVFWISASDEKPARMDSEEQLLSRLAPLFGTDSYLVQEGVSRRRLDGKPVEVRIYMQKNSRHTWMRTGMVARLCKGEILTEETEVNARITEVLEKLYSSTSTRQKVHDELARLSNNVVETVEEHVGGFGELAIDVCIDESNSIKIIELNSKPDNLFSTIQAFKLRNLACYRLLNYAASLAGYETEET